MANEVPESLRPALAAVVDSLAAGDYAAIDTSGDVGTWIRQYPATLRPLPPEAWADADAVPIETGGWSVVVPLWTVEEGRSDLSLTATVYESPVRVLGVDVHVL
jgi:hypothetical protein